MIEKIGLFLSVILNILLIWDKFKPKGTKINCNLSKVTSTHYQLVIKNPNDKLIKISRILLDDEDLLNYQLINQRTKFPIIIQPENIIQIDIYFNLSKGQPTNCKVTISRKIRSKTIESSL